MEHFLPFLLVLLVVIGKIISVASKQTANLPPPTQRRRTGSYSRGSQESEAERRRRFIEAVGLPPETIPPAPVQPRDPATPAPMLPVNPPGPSLATAGRLRRVPPTPPQTASRPIGGGTLTRVPPQQPEVRRTYSEPAPARQSQPLPAVQFPEAFPLPPLAAMNAPAPAAPVMPALPGPVPLPGAPAAEAPAQLAGSAAALLNNLRDPASIRQAIVMREILGPPKALQTMTLPI